MIDTKQGQGSALKELEAFYNVAKCSLLAIRRQKRNPMTPAMMQTEIYYIKVWVVLEAMWLYFVAFNRFLSCTVLSEDSDKALHLEDWSHFTT